MGFFSFLTPFIKPLAKAVVGPLVGGLLGGNKGGQTSTSRTNFKQLRDDAAAAGFNPLTALRATGGRGNVTSTTNPILGSKQLLGDIIGGGISAALDFDPFEEKRQRKREDLEDQLLEAELQNIQARTGKLNNSMFPPKKVETGLPPMKNVRMRIRVFDGETGRNFTIPDPELTESGPSEMVSGMTLLGSADALQNGLGIPESIKQNNASTRKRTNAVKAKEKRDHEAFIRRHNEAMNPFSSFLQ